MPLISNEPVEPDKAVADHGEDTCRDLEVKLFSPGRRTSRADAGPCSHLKTTAVILVAKLAQQLKSTMANRIPAFLIVSALSVPVLADALDAPPEMDQDPRCLARKAAYEAYLKSIYDAPVRKGKPCPPDPETVLEREIACRAQHENSRLWEFISDGFESGSSMLELGIPYIVQKLGKPIREEQDDGFWDIDVYEIPRTLYFPGVTVTTRDFVSDAVNFDLATGTVKPTNAIYEMRVESGNFQFAHGLTPDSTRDEVEAALGLPCRDVANRGRTAVRKQTRYRYADTSDEERSRYSVTFNFHGARRLESVDWYYQSVWH